MSVARISVLPRPCSRRKIVLIVSEALRCQPCTRTSPSRTSTAGMIRSAPNVSTSLRTRWGDSAAAVPITMRSAPQSSHARASRSDRIPPPTCSRRSRFASRRTTSVSTGRPLREASRSTTCSRDPRSGSSASSTSSGEPYFVSSVNCPPVSRTAFPCSTSIDGITSIARSSSGSAVRPSTIFRDGIARRKFFPSARRP